MYPLKVRIAGEPAGAFKSHSFTLASFDPEYKRLVSLHTISEVISFVCPSKERIAWAPYVEVKSHSFTHFSKNDPVYNRFFLLQSAIDLITFNFPSKGLMA